MRATQGALVAGRPRHPGHRRVDRLARARAWARRSSRSTATGSTATPSWPRRPRAAPPAWSCTRCPTSVPANVPLVLVEDTTRALGRARRPGTAARFTIPVVAVTGSNGKTTTKELTPACWPRAGRCCKPDRSLQQPVGPAAHAAAADARAPGGRAGDRHQRPRRDRRAGRAGRADGGHRHDRRGRAHRVPGLARRRARGEGRAGARARRRRRRRPQRRRRARGRDGAGDARARGDLRARRRRPRAGGRRRRRRRARPVASRWRRAASGSR